jgi:hypothetical protein
MAAGSADEVALGRLDQVKRLGRRICLAKLVEE